VGASDAVRDPTTESRASSCSPLHVCRWLRAIATQVPIAEPVFWCMPLATRSQQLNHVSTTSYLRESKWNCVAARLRNRVQFVKRLTIRASDSPTSWRWNYSF